MNKSVVITARISEALSGDLDRLASMRDRSRAWLIEKAVAALVAEDLELRAALEEAEAEIDRGDFITHEDLMAELRTEFGKRQAA